MALVIKTNIIKYPIESRKAKDVMYIVDHKVREIVRERLDLFGNKEKEAFKDILGLMRKA